MKPGIIILLFLSVHASAQNAKFPKLKISVPCNQEFLDKYKGKWLIPDKTLFNSPNNNYSQGAMKRITDIHELVKQIYPEPVGSDAYWSGSYTKSDFGYTIKYVTQDDRTHKEYVNRFQVEGWKYSMQLFAWFCTENAKEISNGFPDAGGGNAITVDANRLTVLTGEFMDDDGWTIDGRPIKRKMPVIGKWKGYDVMATNGGNYADQNNTWFILIAKQGMLPYIPVTRKQYLDRAIAYATKFYDKIISSNEQIPEKAEREENKNRNLNAKNSALKKFQDELEKTRKDGLLDAPAVVGIDVLLMNEGPIFLPESEGGILLTTENPNYFRRDLPAYVPQLFVLSWSWGTKKWEADFRKAIEEKFPIENLQAMIDK
ncbi:MAG TPA: hypothetical protein VIV35_06115 [Chitinophagaceae bacterium]